MHSKSGRRAENVTYSRKGTTSGWWWEVGTTLVFDQMAAPVPEIMDGCL
jgi:hypothetical protein